MIKANNSIGTHFKQVVLETDKLSLLGENYVCTSKYLIYNYLPEKNLRDYAGPKKKSLFLKFNSMSMLPSTRCTLHQSCHVI